MKVKIIFKNDECLAVNLETLKIFAVTETEAEILSLYDKGEKIADIAAALTVPAAQCTELVETFYHPGTTPTPEDCTKTTQALFMVALDCNMKCGYCYGDHGTYNRERALMRTDTALKALEAVDTLEGIIFFGGEPLLNFPLIRDVVQTVHPPACWIITNGTVMTKEIVSWLKKYNIYVAVSIDGPEPVHNAARVFPDGSGTHATVMETVTLLKKANIPVAVETTFTKETLTQGYSVHDILEYVYTISSTIHISPFGIVNDARYRLSLQELTDFYVQRIDFVFDKIEKGEPINIPDITKCISNIISPKRVQPTLLCPHYAQRMTVFPNGDVYPCFLLSDNKYACGNVTDPKFTQIFPEKNEKILSHLWRDKLTKSYWFLPFVTRICAGDVTVQDGTFSLRKDFVISNEKAAEHLLYKMSHVQNWSTFLKTLQKNPLTGGIA